jgi:hypothetical protein
MSEKCFFNEDQPSFGMICVIYGSNNAKVQLNQSFLHEDAFTVCEWLHHSCF